MILEKKTAILFISFIVALVALLLINSNLHSDYYTVFDAFGSFSINPFVFIVELVYP